MTDQVIEHLMEIKERMAKIETTLESHVENSAKRDAKVEKIELKVTKAETALRTLRWILGICLISLPATVAAVLRISKGG